MKSTLLKRLLVGAPISTHFELHHRLNKRVALAVFSSDALSSSAYATDEILLVLVAAGTLALAYSTPIALAVVLILGVVIFSYRQTVQAYPAGGGAYRVAHENLGVPYGLVAAAALLIDYVLTVAVSTAAGLAAVGAALPEIREHRVGFAVGVVALITALNLRGLKESGTIFAIPTYGFLVSMGITILYGTFQVLFGHHEPHPPPPIEAVQPLTLFLILRAFASGSTALTGIEAISDGVPAFKPPESKNAAQTLLTLGIILSLLFGGITFLSKAYQVDPQLIEHGETVTSQIAHGVFGEGNVMFYIVQAFIALILFLAANTSYADFPRLASILAKDRYLPAPLKNRGDRLAFSNGIVILALAACGVLVNYEADVHKIIPLYVVGVFTSFTLSQAGMVVHAVRGKRRATERGKPPDPQWKRKAVISGIGATTTFIVLIIVAITKFLTPVAPGEEGGFRGGAWQVILLMAFLAWVLYRIKSHYRDVEEQLSLADEVPAVRNGQVVLLVTRYRGATKALAFARLIAQNRLRVVALGASDVRLASLRERWESMGVTTPIEPVGNRISHLLRFVRSLNPTQEEPVTVVFADAHYRHWSEQLLKNRMLFFLKRAFLFEPRTVLVSVPFDPETEPEPRRLQAPGRLALIVVVSAVHKATVRAIQYARSLHPSELKAMSIQTEPGEAAHLTQHWSRLEVDVPLEIVDSPFRTLIPPLRQELRELQPNPHDAVGVVVPEFVVRKWWHTLLHTQTAFFIKASLLFEPNVVVISVPYRLGQPTRRRADGKQERRRELVKSKSG
ncbi:MAG: APC family permease [Actinomycetota bacterium]|nr:APC family permease [Actinomycetota bacterium]